MDLSSGFVQPQGTSGQTTPFVNGSGPLAPLPQPAKNPAVVTSQPAQNIAATIKSNVAQVTNGVQQQAQNVATANANKSDIALSQQQQQTQANQTQQNQAATTKAQQDQADALAKATSALTTPTSTSTSTVGNPVSGTVTGDGKGGFTDEYGNAVIIQNGQAYYAPNEQVTTTPKSSVSPSLGTPTDFNGQIQDTMSASDQALKDFQASVAQIQNGTFPLSTSQQALLSSTQSQFQQLVASQQLANQNQQGGVTANNISTGLQRYAPNAAVSNLQGAINAGNQAISKIETDASAALAKLEQGFQTDDLTLVKDSYDAFTTAMTAKTAELQKMSDAAEKAVVDAQTAKYQDMQQQIAQGTLDATKTRDAATAAYQAGQLTETQRKDLVDESIAQENSLKGTYSIHDNPDGTQSIFDTRTGKDIGVPTGSIKGGNLTGVNAQGNQISVGNTGIPIIDNNTTISASGIPYVDGTAMPGKAGEAAQLDAAKLGIPYLPKTSATIVAKISDATTNLQQTINDLKGLTPANATQRLGSLLAQPAEKALQSDPNLASFQSDYAQLPVLLGAISQAATSGGMRSPALIQMFQSYLPSTSDTVATAQAKIAKVQGLLNDAQAPFFGGTDKFEWMQAASNPKPLATYAASSPAHQQAVQKALTAFPTYTPSQIMQILPGDVSGWSISVSNQESQ